jgi:hypothetical protein
MLLNFRAKNSKFVQSVSRSEFQEWAREEGYQEHWQHALCH